MSVEDHQITGGLGGAIAEVLTSKSPCYLYRHGVQNRFCESGGGRELMERYELDSKGIIKHIKNILKNK